MLLHLLLLLLFFVPSSSSSPQKDLAESIIISHFSPPLRSPSKRRRRRRRREENHPRLLYFSPLCAKISLCANSRCASGSEGLKSPRRTRRRVRQLCSLSLSSAQRGDGGIIAAKEEGKRSNDARVEEAKASSPPRSGPRKRRETSISFPHLPLFILPLLEPSDSSRAEGGRLFPERKGKEEEGLSKYFSPSSPLPASPLSPLGMAFPVLARKEEGRIGLGTEEKKKGRGFGSLFPPSEERVAQGYTTRSSGGKEGREPPPPPPPPSSFP